MNYIVWLNSPYTQGVMEKLHTLYQEVVDLTEEGRICDEDAPDMDPIKEILKNAGWL